MLENCYVCQNGLIGFERFYTCCVRGGEKVEEGGREDGPDGEGPDGDHGGDGGDGGHGGHGSRRLAQGCQNCQSCQKNVKKCRNGDWR